jgi:hypothetical protein
MLGKGQNNMAVQSATSYSLTHGAAYPGMLADQQLSNVVSRLNKSATVTIPFGRGVVSDGDDGAKLPTGTSTAAQFVGITQRELTRAYREGDVFGAVPNRDFAVITQGVVYVVPVVAVVKDDPVYIVLADGTFTDVAGAGAVLIPNAKWVSSAAAGVLAKISLGLGG